ncbi:ABC1-domain-containing protein [Macrolepiota fuliginosa MF-IS2]|uniref:ABC1-domain-containing protein n=1 Tax=Macrolepiota fuliginosa MF-IS2 TaxID=1400762 RepID=A0A9P5XNN0_9AGAR|nr:ABC1-domain-containing protein [Macrolepiota fuliginosa MF-IS2]
MLLCRLGLRLPAARTPPHVYRLSPSAFPRHASSWARPSFFTRAPPIRSFIPRRHALWIIPVAGGLTLYLLPTPKSLFPSIFSSPTLIPCPSPTQSQPRVNPTIFSPSESDRIIKARIVQLLQEHIWEPILTAKRFIFLFVLFVPVIITSPMLLIGKPEKRLKGDKWGAVWWYGFLVYQMEGAGPTFIKLAQWAASRKDLFPALLCEKLGSLHSQGRPHSLEHTKRVIERVFQRPFDEVFEEFDEVPIGTGAIAQVYRATLKKDLIPPSYLGPRRKRKSPGGALAPVILKDPPPSAPSASVAIKILHPRVSKTISRDLSIMHFFARVISLLPGMKWISLPEEVEVFGSMMNQQLDLRNEVENLIAFENNFAPRKVPVTFPRPLKVWSTNDVLVEEFENALPMELFLRNGGGPYDEQVATVGLDAFLNMLLLDNFVHSDLHPGNIMIKFCKPLSTRMLLENLYNHIFHKKDCGPNDSLSSTLNPPADYSDSDKIVSRLRELKKIPAEWHAELDRLHEAGYIPEVVFIDAGLVTTLDATNRRNFLDLFRAVAEFDGYRTGQLMVERSRSPELAIDTETFALKMQHLVLSVKRKTFSLGQITISDLLTEVLKNVREHHVKLEGDFINTVISILLLEGIGRQLDPGLDLFASALPILRQLGSQMASREGGMMKDMPKDNLGALLKVWVWLEARSFISGAIVSADEMVKYDWFCPSI